MASRVHELRFEAIVLAGGSGGRMGGVDKPMLEVDGMTLLERALTAASGAATTVVVGPRRRVSRRVKWVREEPPGSGPVAALAAAVPLIGAEDVLVLAADLVRVDAAVVRRLREHLEGHDGVIAVDREGRDQYLLGVYRTSFISGALARMRTPAGASLRELLEGAELSRVEEPDATIDVDSWSDLEQARARREGGQGG